MRYSIYSLLKLFFLHSSTRSQTLKFKILFIFLISIASEYASSEVGKQDQYKLRPTRIIISGSNSPDKYEDTPSSVSVLGESKVNLAGNDSFQNSINTIPNLNFASGSNRPRFFQIRGIGELEQYEGAPNSSVAVIFDEVDLTGVAAALQLFDISQVEVHRGPQAVRFGSSALAGAVFISSKEPNSFTDGQYQIAFGNDQLQQFGVAMGGSLSESTNIRFSGFLHQQNNFRNNEYLDSDHSNQRDERLGRAKLSFKPNSDLKIATSFSHTKFDNAYDAFSIYNGFNTQSDRPGKDQETLKLSILNAEYSFSNTSKLNSISSYYQTSSLYSYDGDWGNDQLWSSFNPYDYFSQTERDRSVFSQQFRYSEEFSSENGPSTWLGGLYFQGFSENSLIDEFSNNLIFDQLDSDYSANTYSAFSNFTYPLSKKLKYAIGMRLEQRNSQYVDSKNFDFQPEYLMLGGSSSLTYQASESNLYYLLFSRSFKGGGFNANPSLANDRRSYDPESLVNLELGTKSNYFNGDLTFALSSFLNFRNQQQIKLGLQVDPSDPLSFSYINDNAASGRSAGLELESTYRLNRKILLACNGGLISSKIMDVDPALENLRGRSFSYSPFWQYSTSADYFFAENLALQLMLQGRDSFYFDDSNNQKSQPYSLFHTSLRYQKKNWEFQFWARNLLNKRYATRGFYFGNEPPDFPEKLYVQLGDPRTFGLTAIYRF